MKYLIKEAGLLKLTIAFSLFFVLPFLINKSAYSFVWDYYSCRSTSFFPECDIDQGNTILFMISMGAYYYILPLPLVIPTMLSVLFFKITKKKI